MKRIEKGDWDQVHEIACEIVNASSLQDNVLHESKIEALFDVLRALEKKYGTCSRITATFADYSKEEDRAKLYRAALTQARSEGDGENERLILESLEELGA